MKKILSAFLNLLMPAKCFCCHKIVCGKSALCPDCFKKITQLSDVSCPICAHPYELAAYKGMICPNCLKKRPVFRQLKSALAYDQYSRDLILPFKHADRTDIAPFFVQLMTRAGSDLLYTCDAIVPVPLHWRRLIVRKYNQAAILANQLAKRVKKPYLPDTLMRHINTANQGHSSPAERKKNVKGAFSISPKKKHLIKGKRILLIDDVYTTGSTINECARELYKAGAAEVNALTIARVCRNLTPHA